MEARVYSSPHCGYCKQAISYLRDLGIRVKVKDISRDQRAAEELVKKTGQTAVPVIFIKGSKIVGFDKKKIDKVLNL